MHVTTRLKSPARVVFLQSVISPVGGRGKGEISLLRIVIRWRTLKANNRYASTSTRNYENKRREITIIFCDKLYYGIIRKTITRETFYNRFFCTMGGSCVWLSMVLSYSFLWLFFPTATTTKNAFALGGRCRTWRESHCLLRYYIQFFFSTAYFRWRQSHQFFILRWSRRIFRFPLKNKSPFFNYQKNNGEGSGTSIIKLPCRDRIG